jgi:hypothetical protein
VHTRRPSVAAAAVVVAAALVVAVAHEAVALGEEEAVCRAAVRGRV